MQRHRPTPARSRGGTAPSFWRPPPIGLPRSRAQSSSLVVFAEDSSHLRSNRRLRRLAGSRQPQLASVGLRAEPPAPPPDTRPMGSVQPVPAQVRAGLRTPVRAQLGTTFRAKEDSPPSRPSTHSTRVPRSGSPTPRRAQATTQQPSPRRKSRRRQNGRIHRLAG